MPAKQEPNIGINYGWAGGESGINLQLDENWRAIGALLQLSVISKTTDVPASPSPGDRYIVPVAATGAWSGLDGKVARYNEGAWEIYTPLKGWLAYIEDEAGDGQYQFFDGAKWVPAPIDDAGQVTYSNITSGLTALDVQSAIDELATGVSAPVQSVDGKTGAVDLSANYEAKRQNNLSATTDPGVTDDSGLGYEPLSRWINTSTGEIWLCVSAAAGAANWQKASLTIDELGSLALANNATDVPYTNTTSGLAATQVQSAIDEVDSKLDSHIVEKTANTVTAKQLAGPYSTTSLQPVKIGTLTCQITTKGGPVLMLFKVVVQKSGTAANAGLKVLRDGIDIGCSYIIPNGDTNFNYKMGSIIDNPPSGTHKYEFYWNVENSTDSLSTVVSGDGRFERYISAMEIK